VLVSGCDIGSLTAKAVILRDGQQVAACIEPVGADASASAASILKKALAVAGLSGKDLDCCCATGYGRQQVAAADMNMSEISCHGLGAHSLDESIRTIIDIGGQDCKVIAVDAKGGVQDFAMNDKCAAGTGRCLEVLAGTIEVELSKLGALAQKSRKPVNITNKCSIFMELEVIDRMLEKKKQKDIAAGICDAVARRVAGLAKSVGLEERVCVTGGVAQNLGVIERLAGHLGMSFVDLPINPQMVGAYGAAVFAERAVGTKKGA